MTGHDKKSDADEIQEIIEADKQRALTRFRSSRFGDRLEIRIREQAAPRRRPAQARTFLRPVWVSLTVLTIVAAATIWLLRPRTGASRSEAVVEAWLHGLPGLQAIENPPRPLSVIPSVPRSPLEKNITSVLSRSAGSPGALVLERSRGIPVIEPLPEPLGLEKVYEILVIEKSVERVLSGLSSKTKEG